MAELVSKLSLESFTIESEFVETVFSLAPVKKMETLKIFSIRSIDFTELQVASAWLPKCLPRNLQSLQIHFVDYAVSGEDKNLNDNFLRCCDLASVTPHLKSLEIKAKIHVVTSFHQYFASLPLGLLKFGLEFENTILHPEAMSLLPRSLKQLRLVLNNHCQSQISNKYFEGLPEALQSFSLELAVRSSINAKVFEILPKSIVDLDIVGKYSISMQRKLQKATKKFLKRNRLLL